MKLTNKYISFVTLSALAMLLFTSCSQKEAFVKSVIVPSATGIVKMKKDKNNNYSINVSVKDLPPPKNLTPAKDIYVVWNESNNGTVNIGQLKSTRSIIARGFKGSISAVSANKPKRIFITAEDNSHGEFPGPVEVLTTNNF